LAGEGGHWAPLYRNDHGNAILFLIASPDFSAWHRIPEGELWVHLAGAPVALHTIEEEPRRRVLGRGVDERISHLVSAGTWMAARSTGAWSLVTCSLAPAFTEMTLATSADVEEWLALFPQARGVVEGLLHA
jgi:predicted cupin superfamily sugar epimerase